ncbi:MAG: Rid family detoxifying hydrolase [Oscillospiraceae bacterium]|nr:Rid family detoxifying hydrolase [Oscillospiraceae bacterium]
MEFVSTTKAPTAIGPYSQAVRHDNILFTSGQIPIDPATGEVDGNTIEQQARRSLSNLLTVLEAGGSSAEKILKTTCFIADMNDFAAFNQVYSEYISTKPARSCVAVKELPKSVLVEVEAVAVID